jgi:hypothetical protein
VSRDRGTEEGKPQISTEEKHNGKRPGKGRLEALQAAGFVLLFLLILWPVSYMVRTNGDRKGIGYAVRIWRRPTHRRAFMRKRRIRWTW